MKQLASAHGVHIQVKSAGVSAVPGAPASHHTDMILKNRGIDLQHASQPVTPDLIEWSDLILTMTTGHKDILLRYFPEAIPKSHTVKEFGGYGDGDVMDPFGGALEVYQNTEKELEQILYKIVTKLREN